VNAPPVVSSLPLDRARTVAWILDKARAEDETAGHLARRATLAGAAERHQDRARAFRDIAHGIARNEPDNFFVPGPRPAE